MTCEQFRALMTAHPEGPHGISRGERAASAVHWRDCEPCRLFTRTFDESLPPMTPEEDLANLIMAMTDSMDPEVLEMIRKK